MMADNTFIWFFLLVVVPLCAGFVLFMTLYDYWKRLRGN